MKSNTISRRSLLKFATIAPAGIVGFHTPKLLSMSESDSSAIRSDSLNNVSIRDVQAFVLRRSVFVKVESDQGITGWGECSPSGDHRVTAAMVNKQLRPIAIDTNVFDTDPLWHKMFFDSYKLGPMGVLMMAISGIDLALWDLKGKLLETPVWKLLGGKHRDWIDLYYSYGRRHGAGEGYTPVQAANLAEEYVAQGYNAIKFRMQWRQTNRDPDPDTTLEYAQAIRDAIGYNINLMIDANNGYTVKRAIEVGKQLYEEYGVSVFEEPVSQHNYRDLSQVVEALDMQIAAGEHEYTRWQARDLITKAKIDVINPDVAKAGGITECMRIAAISQAYNIPIVVHNTQAYFGTAASVHYVASLFNADYPQEYSARRLEVNEPYFYNYLELKNGRVKVPDDPGLGLQVNEEAVIEDAE